MSSASASRSLIIRLPRHRCFYIVLDVYLPSMRVYDVSYVCMCEKEMRGKFLPLLSVTVRPTRSCALIRA
jgi:hypothetical protein